MSSWIITMGETPFEYKPTLAYTCYDNLQGCLIDVDIL